jgi:hypothetical protein
MMFLERIFRNFRGYSLLPINYGGMPDAGDSEGPPR